MLLKLTFLWFVSLSSAQNKNLDKIEVDLQKGNYTDITNRFSDIFKSELSPSDVAKFHLLKAKYFESQNNDKNSFENYLIAKKKYLALNDKEKAMDINLNIAFLLSCFQNKKNLHQSYIEEYLAYAVSTKDNRKLLKGYVEMASATVDTVNFKKSLYFFRKALQLNKKIKDQKQQSRIYNNLSVLFSDVLKQSDSSLYYLKKDYEILSANKDSLGICYNLMNQASNYYHLKKHNDALLLLKQANKINVKKYQKNNKANINKFLYYNLKELGNTEKSLYHYELYTTSIRIL